MPDTHYIEVSADGTPRRMSEGASDWLEDKHTRRLEDEIQRLDASDAHHTHFRLDDWRIRIVELHGTSWQTYLAVCSPPDNPDVHPGLTELTDRQREVAEYAATGATTRDIGEALDISPNTVKHHLKAIYEQLGIGSRVELANALTPDPPPT